MDTRDISILTQVAWKEAAAQARHEELDVTSSDGYDRFGLLYTIYSDALFAAVEANFEAKIPQRSQPAPSAPQAERPVANYDPTPDDSGQIGHVDGEGFAIKIVNDQKGPLPDWLIDQARAAGITEVWDNRGQLSKNGKPLPPFKHAVDVRNMDDEQKRAAQYAAKVFWPPKAGR